MKFVRQANLSDSHFDANGEECWFPPHYVEEPLVEAWLAGLTTVASTPMVVEEATDGAFFDPGGMIALDEPECWIVVHGQRLGAFLRSVDTLVPALRRPGKWGAGADGPPHHRVRGAFKHVLLTPATALAAADLFAVEGRARAAEADARWAQRDAALTAGGVLDLMAVKNPQAAVVHEARRAAAEGGH